MKLETKFNIGDHAWYMCLNKSTEIIISAINISIYNTNQDSIKYNAQNAVNPISWLDHQNLFENSLFKSKEELLKSL